MHQLVLIMLAVAITIGPGDTKGVIGGRVTDSQNAAVFQAVIELTNDIDGRRQETNTNDEGYFEYRFVDAGEYTITVSSTGFSVVEAHAVVRSGQRVEINISLKQIRVADEQVTITS